MAHTTILGHRIDVVDVDDLQERRRGVRLVNPKEFWYTGSSACTTRGTRMDILVGQELEYERAEWLRVNYSYMLSENYRIRV